MVSMSQLQGISYDRASLFGMPHLGCEYTDGTGRYRVLEGEQCLICGAYRPLNAHHVVYRSVRKQFFLNGRGLRSPLFCLCGSGTQGCHGDVHAGRYKVLWEWDSPENESMWWSGELLDRYGPHSDELFGFGKYVIHDKKLDLDIHIRGIT